MSLLLGLGVLVCILMYVLYRRAYSVFSHMGVTGPTPFPLLGNLPQLLTKGVIMFQQDVMTRYGKVVGFYTGSRPTLIVGDVSMLKQIQVKEFTSFCNRRKRKPGTINRHLEKMMNRLEGEEWKHVRNVVTPTFSSGKLKKMTAQMNRCSQLLVENLHPEEPFDVKAHMGAFTMDIIASTAFGIDIDSQKDPEDPFIVHAKSCFQMNMKNPIAWLILLFPSLAPFITRGLGINIFPDKSVAFFASIVEQAMATRTEADRGSRSDFLQLMVNAHNDQSEGEQAGVRRGLTHEEVLSQGFVFFLAGYTTMSDALTYILYLLSLHQDIQAKVQQELEVTMPEDSQPDHDSLQRLPYLDQVVHESLRLYSPAVLLDRTCNRDTTINGIHFPKDMHIAIPIQAIHMDPELWPEPQKFDPERFSPENRAERDPFNYQVFGMGPRNCIGNRLALMVIKIGLVYLLRRYKVEPCEKTEIPLRRTKLSIQPRDVILKVTQRS